MRNTRTGNWIVLGLFGAIALAMTLPAHGATAKRKNQSKELPKWSSVEQLVSRHLKAQPGYQSGDLLIQSKVEPVFEQLRTLGWVVPDRRVIVREVLPDNDFIATKLSSKQGVKFMRQISGYPEGYDRLYRLAGLRGGRRTVSDLVNGRGGAEFIQYLTTSKGGKNLGAMLNNVPKGHDFNKPVGKLFTEKELVSRLKKSYVKAKATNSASGVATGK